MEDLRVFANLQLVCFLLISIYRLHVNAESEGNRTRLWSGNVLASISSAFVVRKVKGKHVLESLSCMHVNSRRKKGRNALAESWQSTIRF